MIESMKPYKIFIPIEIDGKKEVYEFISKGKSVLEAYYLAIAIIKNKIQEAQNEQD